VDSLTSALAVIQERFSGVADLMLYPLEGGMGVYLDGLVEAPVDEKVLQRLLRPQGIKLPPCLPCFAKPLHSAEELVCAILEGQVVLLQDQDPVAQGLQVQGGERRSVEEPAAERVIRGPREGFVESLRVNTALIRRRLKTPSLRVQSYRFGRLTQTAANLLWIEGVATPALVSEVQRRLELVDLEAVIESSYVEELIQDRWYSPFPQILNTERPDTAVASLVEGRVILVIDGSPSVLVMPAVLSSFMQSNEDYYERFQISSTVRLLRYLFLLTALVAPSLYIAATSFQPQLFPTHLFESVAGLRESVPFPALLEAAMMETIFEVMREAGLRLPTALGQAISIVGALVIGEAAVRAGLVSPLMVIVVAITGIANFMLPRYNFGTSIRLLRFPLMLVAGTLGMIGICAGLVALLLHLCALKSFGVPYLSPASPWDWRGTLDYLIRAPHKLLDRRRRPRLRAQR
jgi:hypothetical protein